MQDGGGPVVFLQHGLFCGADIWISHYADEAPAFRLARQGYDVWLGNNRGNLYSRKHISLDPDKDAKQFFNHSFSELGLYDMPA